MSAACRDSADLAESHLGLGRFGRVPFWDSAFLADPAPSATGAAAARLLRPFVSVPSQERSQLACVAALVARPPAFLGVRGWPGAQCEGSGGVWLALAVGAAWWSDDGGADLLGYASGEGRGSLVRVRDARRLTRAPSNLATFDLRAETMFWAVENPSPSISKCLDGGFCELYVCEPLNRFSDFRHTSKSGRRESEFQSRE